MKIKLTIPEKYLNDTIKNSLLNAIINKTTDDIDWLIAGVNEITKTNTETLTEATAGLGEYFLDCYGKRDCFTITIDEVM